MNSDIFARSINKIIGNFVIALQSGKSVYTVNTLEKIKNIFDELLN